MSLLVRAFHRLERSLYSREAYRERWMRRHYDRFRARMREQMFLSIAVFCFHNQPSEGWYFEFGCHKGRTMRAAWDAFHALFDFTYVAFDSFEGLPDIQEIDRMPIWKKGDLKTTEEGFIKTVVGHGMPREKLVTVKGFYETALTPELQARFLPTKAAVVFVDCDLYASTVPVLEFVKPLLQPGTVIVFDDWFCFRGDPERGQRRAFREFRQRHPHLHWQTFLQTNEVQAFVFLGEGAGSA